MYRFIRSLLFFIPPEEAHYFTMNALGGLCSVPALRKAFSRLFAMDHPSLTTHLLGLTFKNPVGLGAGFDKNARYLSELEALGFGFVEIGTVTPQPQGGNDKPRLFRLPKDLALINRMGFNNEGVEAVAKRLKEWKEKKKVRGTRYEVRNEERSVNSPLTTHHSPLIIGGNIGKNKVTPNEDAWKDYEICFKALHEYVDFFVVNV